MIRDSWAMENADLGHLLELALKHFGSGGHLLGAGALIMLLVALAGRLNLLRFVPEGGRRWVALGLGVLGGIGGGIAAGAPWIEIVITAITSGATAIGLHEAIKR